MARPASLKVFTLPTSIFFFTSLSAAPSAKSSCPKEAESSTLFSKLAGRRAAGPPLPAPAPHSGSSPSLVLVPQRRRSLLSRPIIINLILPSEHRKWKRERGDADVDRQVSARRQAMKNSLTTTTSGVGGMAGLPARPSNRKSHRVRLASLACSLKCRPSWPNTCGTLGRLRRRARLAQCCEGDVTPVG